MAIIFHFNFSFISFMKTFGSLILTCVKEWCFFLFDHLCYKFALKIDSEIDKNVRMDNQLFVNFEIHFSWNWNMKETVIEWKKNKTVICNDQVLPVEGSLLILLRNYYVSTPQFVIKQVWTKQFSTRLQFEPKFHNTTTILIIFCTFVTLLLLLNKN